MSRGTTERKLTQCNRALELDFGPYSGTPHALCLDQANKFFEADARAGRAMRPLSNCVSRVTTTNVTLRGATPASDITLRRSHDQAASFVRSFLCDCRSRGLHVPVHRRIQRCFYQSLFSGPRCENGTQLVIRENASRARARRECARNT